MSEKKNHRVLLVDDDKDILDLLEYNLEKEGFKVKTIVNSRKAVETAKDFYPDLIILDIMMPHPNGIEICRELRSIGRFKYTYIFFLTAKSESYYRQAALDTGGDDYIEKIIGLRALTCKVTSVLKEHFIIRKSVSEVKVGNLKITRGSNSVKYDKREVILSKPEFEMLFFFAQNPHKNISTDNILQNIWGSETYLIDSSVEIYIQSLSRKLGLNLIDQVNNNTYRLNLKV